MNTILIAEDEKFIRRGLKAMIERSSIPIGEILEARDGEKALAVLRSRPIDLLVTDIRMPRMDGIALVSRLEELEHQPLVLVVSGYDDFSYAVEMLRKGAQDYLLKPVEREQLYQALEKLEARYRQEQSSREEQGQQRTRALRQLMLEGCDGQRELLERTRGQFLPGPYVGFCAGAWDPAPEGALCIHGAGGAMLYVLPAEQAAQLTPPLPAGKSGVYEGLEALYSCYQEAYAARKRSFFTGTLCTAPAQPGTRPLGVTARQLAGLVGLASGQEVSRLLAAEAESVSRGETAPDAFAQLCADFIQQLRASYQDVLTLERDADRFADLWSFPGCAQYLEELNQWLDLLCVQAAQKFSDFENKQKIRQAVQYMQQNFRQSLNMAQVSNYVSMNYSLFSLLFKQYSGLNFVNYLQNLRLDEAKRLLVSTDWRVNEIGHRAGFGDEKRFLKVFKAAVGVSPTEYRKSAALLQQNGQATPCE